MFPGSFLLNFVHIMTFHGQQLKTMTFQVFHDLCEPSGYRFIESVTVTGSPGTEKPEFSQQESEAIRKNQFPKFINQS